MSTGRQVILTADDFGLSAAVNEAVERAHLAGMLNTASLMVAGEAAADAVARAHRLPRLHVGLHLVVIEGPACLPLATIPGLVGADGQFPATQLKLGLRYFAAAKIRRQLRAEIAAQYAAFAATGLQLDHANAHKHMHLHPTIGRYLIEEGRRHGLRAVRVPAEPPGAKASMGARALYRWTGLLRRQVRRAGLVATDHVFGLSATGRMTRERLLPLIAQLPPGVSEIYFHPATHADAAISRVMPNYRHAEELAALLDPAVADAMPPITSYSALAGRTPGASLQP